MFRTLWLAILAIPGLALAQGRPAEASAKVEMTTGTFEMVRLAPGQTEAFLRGIAEWEKVGIAGGQQPSQVFLHAGGEGVSIRRSVRTTWLQYACGATSVACQLA